ncbi:hypothetical protein N9A50_04310 [Acidimicrobiaceae bacterium]|nr:hypothetical protein [Acidimicrobiaceae bacterium]
MDNNNMNIKPKRRIILLLAFSFLFSFCSTEEPIVQQTLEDYENVWCVLHLDDVNNLLFLSEEIKDINEKVASQFDKDREVKKLFQSYGSEEKLLQDQELLESFIATARVSFTDYEPTEYTRGRVLELYKTLAMGEDLPQELVSFCKTWYKVSN